MDQLEDFHRLLSGEGELAVKTIKRFANLWPVGF